MSERKSELTPGPIDRGWPHQVALAEDVVRDRFEEVDKAGRELGMAPRGHSVFHGRDWYHVFCFADPAAAETFRRQFDGEPFNPKDRGWGANSAKWRKPPRP